jgi:single-strand DNA-binding protein
MASVNKAIVVGNLGADPDLKYTQANTAVCNLSVATSEKFKDKSGQLQERTEWHRITVWGDMAENCHKYLRKGRSVYVEGRIQTNTWEDKDGAKRYSTTIVASSVVFLGGGNGKSESKGPGAAPDDEGQGGSDNLPF